MKNKLFIGALCCLLTATAADGRSFASEAAAGVAPPAADPTASPTERTQELLQNFYYSYCWTKIFGTKYIGLLKILLEDNLTPEAVQNVAEIVSQNQYDPLIRAQDFDNDALETISVTYIAGDWYAAAYLDRQRNRCVIVPIEATVQNGSLRITDIGIP